MNSVEVYDKAKWHLEQADGRLVSGRLLHLSVMMDWLNKHEMLTAYGREIYDLGINEEFSLTSNMLTSQGNDLLRKYYEEWLSSFNYGEVPSMYMFERTL